MFDISIPKAPRVILRGKEVNAEWFARFFRAAIFGLDVDLPLNDLTLLLH